MTTRTRNLITALVLAVVFVLALLAPEPERTGVVELCRAMGSACRVTP